MYGTHSNSIQANCILLKFSVTLLSSSDEAEVVSVRPLLIWWSWCEQQNKWNKNCGELTMVEGWQVRILSMVGHGVTDTGPLSPQEDVTAPCHCYPPTLQLTTTFQQQHFTMRERESRGELLVMINFTAVMRYFGEQFLLPGEQQPGGMWTIAWPGADWAMSNSSDSSVIRMPASWGWETMLIITPVSSAVLLSKWLSNGLAWRVQYGHFSFPRFSLSEQ